MDSQKYDQHHYYKGMSGVGLSAVDFIALPKEGLMLFIEVKNYCNRPNTQLAHMTTLLTNKENGLAASLSKK
ncbi:MAG: hypothetical protein HC912_02335 [Saprospiraceae bacterium]|nr:hypothetical protein [Saprospiraceae bacterium]